MSRLEPGTMGHAVIAAERGPQSGLAEAARLAAELALANAKLERERRERRRAEQELRALGALRLAEAARAEVLARANDELREFSRVVAHDLQEPLRTIMSYTRLLNDGAAGRLDPETERFLRQTGEGARRMSRLISDLLAYTRVETEGAPLRPVSCAEALAGALANLRAAIAESGARVSWGALPTLPGDPDQLIELFQNLIANAIKFRGREPPLIRIRADRRGGAWVFTVRDNGLGFDPAQAHRLFMIFQRLHPSIPGHGIGLAVCKKIVQRHGGWIWAEAEPGRGATFCFALSAAGGRHGRSAALAGRSR